MGARTGRWPARRRGTGTPAPCSWCGCNWRPPGGRRSLADPGQGRPGRELRGLTRVRGQALQGRAGDWRLTSRTPACDTTTRCRPSRRRCDSSAVRAVRFGRVGGGRCRAEPAGGRTGFALPRRLAGVERTRDACGGRLPRAGRRCGDRIRRAGSVAAPSASAAAGGGRSRISSAGAMRRQLALEGTGHDIEQRNPGRAAQRRALAQEPARCHPARHRGDRRSWRADRPAWQA